MLPGLSSSRIQEAIRRLTSLQKYNIINPYGILLILIDSEILNSQDPEFNYCNPHSVNLGQYGI
tara:strand:+ start:159 stop:350 length:192 start_codon:yes stop_codon:yes gene_type:complete